MIKGCKCLEQSTVHNLNADQERVYLQVSITCGYFRIDSEKSEDDYCVNTLGSIMSSTRMRNHNMCCLRHKSRNAHMSRASNIMISAPLPSLNLCVCVCVDADVDVNICYMYMPVCSGSLLIKVCATCEFVQQHNSILLVRGASHLA